MTPKLILTRPADQNADLVIALRKTDVGPFDVISSPLITIAPIAAQTPVTDVAHVIFTSINGVAQADRLAVPRSATAWCVGKRTADAARAIGFQAHSADGDGVDLLAMISRHRPVGTIAHIHGEHVRIDFAAELAAQGYECRTVVAYAQTAIPLTEEAREAFGGAAPVVAPLYSPRTAALFLADCPVTAPLLIVAISQATAAAIPLGLAVDVSIAATPDQKGMVQATYQALRSLAI